MLLLIDLESNEAYRSLTDDHVAALPDFIVGDVLPVSVSLAPRIVQQWDSNIFAPVDVSDWTIRVALGGFKLPETGTFPVTYDDETASDLISFNPTPEELQSVLNSIETVSALFGLDVIGRDGFFLITFREVGARELIVADPADLVPLSLIEITRTVTGDVDTREVQTLRIRQNVGALAVLSEDSSSPAIVITVLTTGSASANHKIKITMPADRWGGRWTFTALSGTSDFIPYAASAEQVQAKLEAMSVIGLWNVSVSQDTENTFIALFRNGRGLQDIGTITADGTTLKVIGTKSGDLDMRGPAMEFLVPAGKESATATLEVEATPDGGLPEKVLRRDVIVRRGVISSTTAIPATLPGTYMLTGLTGFTGGGVTKVDGAVTVGKAVGSIFRGVVSDVLYEWELQVGTAASSAPGIIRPTDYNVTTNPRNLIQVD